MSLLFKKDTKTDTLIGKTNIIDNFFTSKKETTICECGELNCDCKSPKNTNIEIINSLIENKTKFNSLTVNEYVGIIKDNHSQIKSYVKCRCDCGTEFIVPYTSVKNNYIKNCGKCNIKHRNRINNSKEKIQYHIANKTLFGKTKIIDYYFDINKCIYAKCLCGCGNIFIKRFQDIIDKRREGDLHCGCESITNKVIKTIINLIENKVKCGNLTILEYYHKKDTEKSVHTSIWCKCLCDCGRITDVRWRQIYSPYTKGKTKSCGNCNFIKGCNSVEEEAQYYIDNNIKIGSFYIVKNIGYERSEKSQRYLIEAKCDCGRVITVTYQALFMMKSCGRCHFIEGCNSAEDEIQYYITNKTKFGTCTIIEYLRKEMVGNCTYHYVKYICDCGRILETTYNNIKRGHIKSCGRCNFVEGCNSIEEEIQYHIANKTKFNNVTIIGIAEAKSYANKKPHVMVKLLCSCGRTFEAEYDKVKTKTNKQIKSCGRCNFVEGCNTTEEEIQYHITNKTKFGAGFTIVEQMPNRYFMRKYEYTDKVFQRYKPRVKCLCFCGKYFEADYDSIKKKNKHILSCGCGTKTSSFAERELGKYLHSIIKETRYIETEEKQLRLYYNSNKNYFSYDIVVPYNNKNYIVEYNGTPWHPKSPNQLDKNGNPWKKPHSDESAEYWYYYDQKKKQVAIDNGYEYIVVWDDEPREVVLKRIFETIGYSESNKQRNLTIDDFF